MVVTNSTATTSIVTSSHTTSGSVTSIGPQQTLGVAVRLAAGPQVQRDPGLASEGILRLCTLLSLPALLSAVLPALNPLDYFVWSYIENITNMTSHNTKASLIAVIRRVFADLPPVLVKKACSQFRVRIEAVIETEGSYIVLKLFTESLTRCPVIGWKTANYRLPSFLRFSQPKGQPNGHRKYNQKDSQKDTGNTNC